MCDMWSSKTTTKTTTSSFQDITHIDYIPIKNNISLYFLVCYPTITHTVLLKLFIILSYILDILSNNVTCAFIIKLFPSDEHLMSANQHC